MSTKPDFSFLDRDIESQMDLARQVVDEAKRIDAQLSALPPGDVSRQTLEEAKRFYLNMAKRLANNANNTASEAISVMRHFTRVSSA